MKGIKTNKLFGYATIVLVIALVTGFALVSVPEVASAHTPTVEYREFPLRTVEFQTVSFTPINYTEYTLDEDYVNGLRALFGLKGIHISSSEDRKLCELNISIKNYGGGSILLSDSTSPYTQRADYCVFLITSSDEKISGIFSDSIYGIEVEDEEVSRPFYFEVFFEASTVKGFSLSMTPTPTPSPPPTPSPTPTATPIPTPTVPGFEVVFTISSLLAVAYLVVRRRK
jgi:PGF-CTERM protein